MIFILIEVWLWVGNKMETIGIFNLLLWETSNIYKVNRIV